MFNLFVVTFIITAGVYFKGAASAGDEEAAAVSPVLRGVGREPRRSLKPETPAGNSILNVS